MSFDGRLRGVHQVAFVARCFSIEDPGIPVAGREVFLHDPFVGFLRMSPFGPSPQPVIDSVVYCFEDFPAHDMLMILCPSSNDGVQLGDEFLGSERGVFLDDVPHFFQVSLDALSGRFDQQFPAFAVFIFTNVLA